MPMPKQEPRFSLLSEFRSPTCDQCGQVMTLSSVKPYPTDGPRILRGKKRRHYRARLALVVAVIGILMVLVVRGVALLWHGPEIVTANESRSFPLHYHSPSPDVLRSPYRPRSWSI